MAETLLSAAPVPLEVTNINIADSLKLLSTLLDDRLVREFPDAYVPREADGFIGEQRAVFAEKARLIVGLAVQAREVGFEKQPRGALENIIRRLVASSKDHYAAMALISRIWKYCENENSMGPEDFQCMLESYAKEMQLAPLSHAEEFVLLSSLRRLKNGEKPGEILDEIDQKVLGLLDASGSSPDPEEHNGKKRMNAERKFEQMAQIFEYVSRVVRKTAAKTVSKT